MAKKTIDIPAIPHSLDTAEVIKRLNSKLQEKLETAFSIEIKKFELTWNGLNGNFSCKIKFYNITGTILVTESQLNCTVLIARTAMASVDEEKMQQSLLREIGEMLK